MQIAISGEAERFIQAALASGQFASAEEFIAAMARNLQPKVKLFDLAEKYAAQSAAAISSGWDDAEMDVYNTDNGIGNQFESHNRRFISPESL